MTTPTRNRSEDFARAGFVRAVAAMVVVAVAVVLLVIPRAAGSQEDREHPVTGRLLLSVDPEEPILRLRSRWVFFPREQYPWDRLGPEDDRLEIHPDILTAFVNFGCHFEGWIEWRYEETEIEVMADGWVRRRLQLRREDQGGFYNNQLRFKCDLVTRNRAVNRRLGALATMGGAPTSGFQFGISMAALQRALAAINTLDRTEGSWGDYLYRTFKSMLTFNAMDENVHEVDLYFSPDGGRLEFEIDGQRTAIFEH